MNPRATGPARVDLSIALLATAIASLGPLTMTMYLPAMPALTADLGAPDALAKLTLTVYLASFAFGQLVYGPVSDRLGRRPALAAGLVIYCLASALAAVAPSIELLLVARLIQGFGACAGPTIARAMIRDLYSGTTAARAMSVIGMTVAVAPAIGQVFGGLMTEVGSWRWIFVILGLFGVAIFVLSSRRLRETNVRPDPTATRIATMVTNYALLLGSRRFLAYVLAVSCCVGGLFAYAASAPFVLISVVGISAVDYGFLGLFPVAGTFLGTLIINRFAHRVPLIRLIWLGLASSASAGIGQFILLTMGDVSVPTVIGSMTLWMFGFGLLMPGAMAGALGPFPRIAGSASALMGFCQMGVGALGTLLSAALNDGYVLSLALAPALMGLVGITAFALLHRKEVASGA